MTFLWEALKDICQDILSEIRNESLLIVKLSDAFLRIAETFSVKMFVFFFLVKNSF